MQHRVLIGCLAATATAALPASALAGSRASSSPHGKLSLSVASHSGDQNIPRGRTKPKNKFPPGLVDKCNGDDRPGRQGLDRACEGRSRGT